MELFILLNFCSLRCHICYWSCVSLYLITDMANLVTSLTRFKIWEIEFNFLGFFVYLFSPNFFKEGRSFSCMCINIFLKVQVLHRLKIMSSSDLSELVKNFRAVESNKSCMYNICETCRGETSWDKLSWINWKDKLANLVSEIGRNRKNYQWE